MLTNYFLQIVSTVKKIATPLAESISSLAKQEEATTDSNKYVSGSTELQLG